MTQFFNLPIEIMMEVCDILLHRGITIEEVFAKDHTKQYFCPPKKEEMIVSALQKGHRTVEALSTISPRYVPLLQCLGRILLLYGDSFLTDAVRFLKTTDSKPDIAERVRIVYLNLDPTEHIAAQFDEQSDNYLRQLAENGGMPWPEYHWYRRLHNEDGHYEATVQGCINTIARILLYRLPNIEQLGLTLSDLPAVYRNDSERSPESKPFHRHLKHLALRTFKPVASWYIAKGYQIHEYLAVTPTHLFLQDPFVCHIETGSNISPYPDLFQHVTHLSLGGQITHEWNYQLEILRIIDFCAPLQEFRYMNRIDDSGSMAIQDPWTLIHGLKKKHATSLRTLAVELRPAMLRQDYNCVDSFTPFINLENLCITTECISKRQVRQKKSNATRTEGAITTLPRSLIRIYFFGHPKSVTEDLEWLASHREALPDLKFVQFRNRTLNKSGEWRETNALVKSGLKVSLSASNAIEWQV